MYINKWKKPIWKASYTIWFQLDDILEKKNSENSKKISSCQGGRRDELLEQVIFRSGKLFYMTPQGEHISLHICQNT